MLGSRRTAGFLIAAISASLVWSVVGCATLGTGPQITGSVQVEVTVEGRDDASGVTVTAGGQSSVTGADGLVVFEEVTAGEAIPVRAALDGVQAEEIVTVEADQLVSVSLSLARAAGAVAITSLSVNPAGGVPVGGIATVSVSAEDSAGGSLSYDWEITDGWTIDGSGDSAEVRAPEQEGVEGRVTVTVTNDAGASATESADLATIACDQASLACDLLAWSTRHRITVDASEVDEPLTDVPILLILDSNRIDDDAAADDGADLRLVDASLDEFMDHEIDTWDSGQTAYVWVRIPQLFADDGDVELWLYYGNSDAEDGQNPAGVWDSDFAAVWHGNVSGNEPNVMPDSTANANDATSPLNDWPDRLVAALIGRAVKMQGHDGDSAEEPANTYFELAPVSSSLDLTDAFTLEAVVEIDEGWRNLNDGQGVDWAVVQKGPSGNQERYYLGLSRREQVINCRLFPEADADQIRNDEEANPGADGEVSLGVLTYLACTYDGDTLAAFIDGERVQSHDDFEGGPLLAGSDDILHIGRRFDDRRFGGLVDEVRISSVARSDTWFRVQQLAIEDRLVDIGPAQ